jgi:hypothetical protein
VQGPAAALLIVLVSFTLGQRAAADDHEPKGEDGKPCREIREACEAAGFEKKQAKEGKGLYVDCIRPLMTGEAPREKATIALPAVSSELIASCKAKHPNFGKGAEGKKAGMTREQRREKRREMKRAKDAAAAPGSDR